MDTDIFAIIIWVLLVALSYKMAERRNRNAFGWVLGTILFSPLIGIGLLLILGKKEKVNEALD